MEVMMPIKSGPLLFALRIQQKKEFSLTVEGGTTKPLQRSKREATHPLATLFFRAPPGGLDLGNNRQGAITSGQTLPGKISHWTWDLTHI
jgi:hypothetical protein